MFADFPQWFFSKSVTTSDTDFLIAFSPIRSNWI